MKAEFDPVAGKTAIIIETIMSSPDIPSDPGLEFKIRLCVEEVVENIVSYAYKTADGEYVCKECYDEAQAEEADDV